jgi:hypothetical protein
VLGWAERRFDPDERSCVFGRQHVQQTIGTLTYIPNALLELAEQ